MPKFELKNIELPEAAAKPVYAYVGATDLAVEKVREAVTDVQAKVTTTVTEFRNDVTERVAGVQKTVQDFEPKDLQDKAVGTAKARRSDVEQRLTALRSDAKEFPAKIQADVKIKVDENVATVSGLYADLAKRGEGVVTRIRGAEAPAQPAQKSSQATTGSSAKKAPAKKSAAKSTAKKSTAKKSTSQSTAKKSAAKKSTAQAGNQSSTQSSTQGSTQGTAKKA